MVVNLEQFINILIVFSSNCVLNDDKSKITNFEQPWNIDSILVVLAVLFYLFHGKKSLQVAALLIISALSYFSAGGNPFTENYQWMMGLASIPIILYNGKKGRGMRNFFYYFYPAHIYVLFFIAHWLQK